MFFAMSVSRSQDLELTSCRLQNEAAKKNVFGLQVGVSSKKKVCPARVAWSWSVRDDVLAQKEWSLGGPGGHLGLITSSYKSRNLVCWNRLVARTVRSGGLQSTKSNQIFKWLHHEMHSKTCTRLGSKCETSRNVKHSSPHKFLQGNRSNQLEIWIDLHSCSFFGRKWTFRRS